MINRAPFPHLHLAATPEERTPQDEQATQNLLAAYQDETGYTCPLCRQHYTDPTTFLEHMITEANTLFGQITRHGLHSIPKRDKET